MIRNSYTRLTYNPFRHIWQRAQWINNWDDIPGKWVVRFPSMADEVDVKKTPLQTKNG